MRRVGLRDPIVVGVLRGGVPVAIEVATALNAPLDVAVVRKVGDPYQPEYALGAIGEGGTTLLSRSAQELSGARAAALRGVLQSERTELARRVSVYRAVRPQIDVGGRTVVLVDDGLATGATAAAAARDLKLRGAARIVLAVPVCPAEALRYPPDAAIDEVVCLLAPPRLISVGQWYRDFEQVDDEAVLAALREARPVDAAAPRGRTVQRLAVTVETHDGRHLPGALSIPEPPLGVVAFAHGSGSSRTSPRNRMVADVLNRAGFATLLFDLLEDAEAADRRNVFDIPLLGGRLVEAVHALSRRPELDGVPIGLFGASTGGAAALWAAAELGDEIAAVVSRGGRPDLAGPRLGQVTAPTLLLVGGEDSVVIDLNREAAAQMRCPVSLRIVAGATHLFEEAGALERVAAEAAGWFAAELHGGARHVAS